MNSCLPGTTNEGYPSADNRANTIIWTTMDVCCCVFGYITVCYQSLTMKAARSGLCRSITSLRIYFLLSTVVVGIYIFVQPHKYLFNLRTAAQPNTVYWYNFMRRIPPPTRFLWLESCFFFKRCDRCYRHFYDLVLYNLLRSGYFNIVHNPKSINKFYD